MTKVHGNASKVGAEGGDVFVDGPDGVTYSMSPDAATETGNRLLKGASQAQSQRDDGERAGPDDDGA